MINVTTAGYVILDQHGNVLATRDDFLIAKRACDDNPIADRVERASDGAKMCVAPRNKFRRTVPIARAA